jgi:hypothetical protein
MLRDGGHLGTIRLPFAAAVTMLLGLSCLERPEGTLGYLLCQAGHRLELPIRNCYGVGDG